MSQLARHQAQLPAMVCLMSDEVAEKVHDIGREILPGGGGNGTTSGGAETDQANDAVAAPSERAAQFRWSNHAAIDGAWDGDAMACPEHLDPHAPHVVKVRGDRADRATRLAGDRFRPQSWRQVLDEIHRDAVTCAPRGNQRLIVRGISPHVWQGVNQRPLPQPTLAGFDENDRKSIVAFHTNCLDHRGRDLPVGFELVHEATHSLH